MPGRSKIRQVRRAYEFIKAHRDEYDVTTMCRVLDVARTGYYAWIREPLSNRAKEDVRLLRLIRASYKASHGLYGARRIYLDLREAGETVASTALLSTAITLLRFDAVSGSHPPHLLPVISWLSARSMTTG